VSEIPAPAAAGPKEVEPRRPRLYLFTPPLDDPAAFAAALEPALAAGDIAAVLLRLHDADERTLVNRVKTIGALVQARDIALLVDGRADIAARSGADGAHLTGTAALLAALGPLKPDRIAGAGGLHSRHDAMLAAEAGADYVMFGEPPPDPSRHSGNDRKGAGRPPAESVREQVSWWSELFQPPCIGYAGCADEVAPLAQAGADFVALGDWVWTQPDGAAASVAQAAASLAAAFA
jgi:thiamine-phosphate pyrophosphorylase